jgi:hypothetical protein
MDAWPPDSAGRGGDGFIRLLDWETILGRSLGVSLYPGMDTNNYLRFWTNGDIGYPSHTCLDWAPGGPPVPLSLDSDAASSDSSPPKLSVTNSPPGLVWFCQASVGSGTIINSAAGQHLFAAGVRQCFAGLQSGGAAIPGHRHRQQRRAARDLDPV